MSSSLCGVCSAVESTSSCKCTVPPTPLCGNCIIPHFSTLGGHVLASPAVTAMLNQFCSQCFAHQPETICCCGTEAVMLCVNCVVTHNSKFPDRMHIILPIRAKEFASAPGYLDRLTKRQHGLQLAAKEADKNFKRISSCEQKVIERVEKALQQITKYRDDTLKQLSEYRAQLQQKLDEAKAEVEAHIYEDTYIPNTPIAKVIWEFSPGRLALFTFTENGEYKVNVNAKFEPAVNTKTQIKTAAGVSGTGPVKVDRSVPTQSSAQPNPPQMNRPIPVQSPVQPTPPKVDRPVPVHSPMLPATVDRPEPVQSPMLPATVARPASAQSPMQPTKVDRPALSQSPILPTPPKKAKKPKPPKKPTSVPASKPQSKPPSAPPSPRASVLQPTIAQLLCITPQHLTVFNLHTKTMSEKVTLKSLNCVTCMSSAAILSNGNVLVCGTRKPASAEAYIIDTVTGEVTQTANMLTMRGCHGMLTDGEKVLAFGGRGNSGLLAAAEVYSVTFQLWEPLREMLTPRSHFNPCKWQDFVYIFGGIDTKNCEAYDDTHNTYIPLVIQTSITGPTVSAAEGDVIMLRQLSRIAKWRIGESELMLDIKTGTSPNCWGNMSPVYIRNTMFIPQFYATKIEQVAFPET